MTVTEDVSQQLGMESLVTTPCVHSGVRKVPSGAPWRREDDVGPAYSHRGGGFIFRPVGPCIWEEEENLLEVGSIPSGCVQDFGGFSKRSLDSKSEQFSISIVYIVL